METPEGLRPWKGPRHLLRMTPEPRRSTHNIQQRRTKPHARAVCPPLHGTRHALSTRTGGQRPRATHAPAQVGSSARTCNSHAILRRIGTGNRSVPFPVPKQLNKTSYSMRESLSGALMEYSFVHASANPNDGLPRGLNPCSPCLHSILRPLSAPDKASCAPSLRLLSTLSSPSSPPVSCAPPTRPCLPTHLTVAIFGFNPRTCCSFSLNTVCS